MTSTTSSITSKHIPHITSSEPNIPYNPPSIQPIESIPKNETISKTEQIHQELKRLSLEAKSKRSEIDSIKTNIKSLKNEYNNKLKVYQSLIDTIIKYEQQKENQLLAIAKITNHNLLYLNQINEKSFYHLLDMSLNTNTNGFEYIEIFFHFCCFNEHNHNMNELLSIIKNYTNIQSLLQYVEIIYENMHKCERELYEKYSNEFNDMIKKEEELINVFPFDALIGYLKGIFNKIPLKKTLLYIQANIDKYEQEKNEIFIILKKIEAQIQKQEVKSKTLFKYIKGINVLMEKFSELNHSLRLSNMKHEDNKGGDNNNQNNNDNNNNNEHSQIKFYFETLTNAIEQIKLINFDNCDMHNTTDNMSSLSVQSEFSYGEVNSTKSFITINTLNTFNNNDSTSLSYRNNNDKHNKPHTNHNHNTNNNNSSNNVSNIPMSLNMNSYRKSNNIVNHKIKPKKVPNVNEEEEEHDNDSLIRNESHHLITAPVVNGNDNEDDENTNYSNIICDEMVENCEPRESNNMMLNSACFFNKTSLPYQRTVLYDNNSNNNNPFLSRKIPFRNNNMKNKQLRMEKSIETAQCCSSDCALSCI